MKSEKVVKCPFFEKRNYLKVVLAFGLSCLFVLNVVAENGTVQKGSFRIDIPNNQSFNTDNSVYSSFGDKKKSTEKNMRDFSLGSFSISVFTKGNSDYTSKVNEGGYAQSSYNTLGKFGNSSFDVDASFSGMSFDNDMRGLIQPTLGDGEVGVGVPVEDSSSFFVILVLAYLGWLFIKNRK